MKKNKEERQCLTVHKLSRIFTLFSQLSQILPAFLARVYLSASDFTNAARNCLILTNLVSICSGWLHRPLSMGVRRNISKGGNVDILLIFLRFQCKWTFIVPISRGGKCQFFPLRTPMPLSSKIYDLSETRRTFWRQVHNYVGLDGNLSYATWNAGIVRLFKQISDWLHTRPNKPFETSNSSIQTFILFFYCWLCSNAFVFIAYWTDFTFTLLTNLLGGFLYSGQNGFYVASTHRKLLVLYL